MPRFNYSAMEYTDMILIYGECQQNAALALRTYRQRYGDSRRCPVNSRTIVQAVQRIRENRPLVPVREGVPPQEIAVPLEQRVLDYFTHNPTSSLRKAARQFQVHHKTVLKILRKDKRQPYKYTKVQALLPRDRPIREAYCRWLQSKMNDDPEFIYNVMWTDESTFTRNGIWNRHNLRYWSQGNPHLFRESSHQYHFSLNVWAGIHRNQIIGPVFIEGNLTAVKFLDLLSGPISEYTDELSLDVHQKLWYQLDGAPAHSVVSARERLTDMFGQQWIGRYGPRRWPARSPDLTPMDFFLWGFIKNEVYACDVNTVEELQDRIIDAFNKLKTMAISGDLLRKVRNNIIRRCHMCIRVNGGQFQQLKI